ncbi:MAG: helix-turn-helix domain-containing protein [Streptosporangiaceae bacterium]
MTELLTGSTVPRRQLGRYLRDLRESAGLGMEQAARELELSRATLWRVEKGQVSVKVRDVRAMCVVYNATPQMTEVLIGLAGEAKAKGWWQSYGDAVPDWFDLYVGLEAAASTLQWYEPLLIPGLFQSADYARTVITENRPELGAEETDRRVELRIARQTLLRRKVDVPALDVLLNQSILDCPVGGPEIMAAQLDRLSEAGELPNVSIRIVPPAAGFHLGLLTGSFVILRFPPSGNGAETEPPTVYADGFTGALYLDKRAEVERYRRAFDGIRELSLGQAESMNLIHQTAEVLRK